MLVDENLKAGDSVKVIGRVFHSGDIGKVAGFRDGLVVVDLNGEELSFHPSDVTYIPPDQHEDAKLEVGSKHHVDWDGPSEVEIIGLEDNKVHMRRFHNGKPSEKEEDHIIVTKPEFFGMLKSKNL